MKEELKDLNYYKKNAEEDYMQTPISVLRYITELEKTKDNPNDNWICTEITPETKDEILVLIEISQPHTGGRKYKAVYVGDYYNGEFTVREPDVFEYPVNYWEGFYKVLGWMYAPKIS